MEISRCTVNNPPLLRPPLLQHLPPSLPPPRSPSLLFIPALFLIDSLLRDEGKVWFHSAAANLAAVYSSAADDRRSGVNRRDGEARKGRAEDEVILGTPVILDGPHRPLSTGVPSLSSLPCVSGHSQFQILPLISPSYLSSFDFWEIGHRWAARSLMRVGDDRE